MGPEELAALEKAEAEAARRRRDDAAENTPVEEIVDATAAAVDIASTRSAGDVVGDAIDVAGKAAETVADAAGRVVEGIGSLLD